MSLEKGFLRPNTHLDKYTIATGIMSGSVFALSFYGLLYMFREALRIMTSWFGGMTLLELSPRENFLYNLFFASIALIFGLQVCFKFIIENNINHRNKKLRFRKRQSTNDITSLSSVFLFFFAKTGTVLGIMFLAIPLQYDINPMMDFPLFFILAPITLFLNVWMTMTRTLGKKGQKWMIMSFGLISILSVSLAQVNLLDYKAINKAIISQSVELSNKPDLPRTLNSQYLAERSSIVIDLYLVLEDSLSETPKTYWNNARTELELTELAKQYDIERGKRSEFERDRIQFVLHIDSEVKMAIVNDLKQRLRKVGIRKILYSTSIKNSKYPSHYPYFKRIGIPFFLNRYYPEFEQFLDSAEQIDLSKSIIRIPESTYYRLDEARGFNRIEIRVDKKNLFVNNQKTDASSLKSLIINLQKKYSPNFLIVLTVAEETRYLEYINTLDILISIENQLKSEFTLSEFNKPYRPLNRNIYFYNRDSSDRAADQKYPFLIYEWTKEELRLIELINKSKNGSLK